MSVDAPSEALARMGVAATALPSEARLRDAADPARRLIDYYSEVGPDFAAWSPGLNMHFGYYRLGMNPLRLEDMLEQMNREVHERLDVPERIEQSLLDLGCGVGATARSIARRAPRASVTGVTIVPWQVAEARNLTRASGLHHRVRFVQADYRSVPYADESFDGVYAIESACYATGPGKADLLREALRVLKPGGRLVVADGFGKHGRGMNPLAQLCYETMCRWWRIDTCAEITKVRREAERLGFSETHVEEVSWQVAPSVLFIPLVTARFLWRELVLARGRLTHQRWENALAPLLAMVVGAARSAFGYYLVSARKAARV